MRVLLTGGGTGGHVYPALSVAEVLPERAGGEQIEFLFVGTTRGDVERLVTRAGMAFTSVDAAPVRGRGPIALIGAVGRISAGFVQSWRILGKFRPGVVLATGGYASVPVSVAAWLRRIPLVVYLPDVYPGLAVRLLVRLARRVATTTDGAKKYLPPSKTVVTGYPVRAEFWSQNRNAARIRFGFDEKTPVLLVTGATQGSMALNTAVIDALPRLLCDCAILHQTGLSGIGAARAAAARLPFESRERYQPVAYLDDMPAAMAAADLAVMRSGASSLAEPPAAGLPAILVPGSFAGAHQRHNASYMASRGAAVILAEKRLCELGDLAVALLTDKDRLANMKAAATALARPDAALRIADVVLEAVA
jgi:UDP-N-acetylglucosamine--N-acetylmuramyl-(pentapeptide) pyrophosphoryl-undecaprenol N-acetylglucosamine transferase